MNEISSTDTKIITMNKAGATREKSWIAVANALDATKMTIDKYGEEHTEEDHAIRLRAAELIARATGDIKPDGAVTNNLTITPSVSKEEMIKFVNEIKRLTAPSARFEQSGEIEDAQIV